MISAPNRAPRVRTARAKDMKYSLGQNGAPKPMAMQARPVPRPAIRLRFQNGNMHMRKPSETERIDATAITGNPAANAHFFKAKADGISMIARITPNRRPVFVSALVLAEKLRRFARYNEINTKEAVGRKETHSTPSGLSLNPNEIGSRSDAAMPKVSQMSFSTTVRLFY